ncbi:MAG: endo-1,4-beta-xylanase [Lacipirellulaceae bacterium]
MKRIRFALALALIQLGLPNLQAEQVLSDFSAGFDYVFDGFSQSLDQGVVRLHDPNDGWGGGGSNVGDSSGSFSDLSSFSNGRVVVDLSVAATHGVDLVGLELVDADNNRGTWQFNVSELVADAPTRLVSKTKLDRASYYNDGATNIDLSRIKQWNFLGDYSLRIPNPGDPVQFNLSLDRVALSNNAPAYPGAEADAPWRAEAATRVDAIRKADLEVTVTNSLGVALPGATVEIRQQKHAFGFGSAVEAFRLRDETHPNYDPANAIYKQKVEELFNVATVENALKWWPWENDLGNHSNQTGIDAVDWLNERGIKVRGHNVVWPGYENLPPSMRALLDASPNWDAAQQQQARDAVVAHIADVAGTFDGKLVAWDVVNEPRTNRDLFDRLDEGEQIVEAWFHAARAADAEVPLFLNEFSIVNSGGLVDTDAQQQFFDRLQGLKAAGVPLGGIGMQGHFTDLDLTGPEQVWAILDRFATLDLPIEITEFDYQTNDQQLQAEFTRDFLTAVFAHEGVENLTMWGFWEGAHWRPEAALFDEQWNIKPNGQAFLDLVFNQWWTEEELTTDDEGKVSLLGFKGEYEVIISHGDERVTSTLSLEDDGYVLEVQLPVKGADFNSSGNVDAADLAVWQQRYGEQLAGSELLLWQMQLSANPSLLSVPEPSSLLIAVGLSVLAPLRVL